MGSGGGLGGEESDYGGRDGPQTMEPRRGG